MRLKESLHAVTDNPDQLVVSATIGGALAFPATAVIDTAFNAGLAEATSGDPKKVLLAGGVAVATTIFSIKQEARAFKTEGFSSAPGGTILYDVTGKAKASAIADHIFTTAIVSAPAIMAAIVTKDENWIFTGATAAALTVASWNGFFNTLIVKGKMDGVVNSVHRAREKFKSKFRRGSREIVDMQIPSDAQPAFIQKLEEGIEVYPRYDDLPHM